MTLLLVRGALGSSMPGVTHTVSPVSLLPLRGTLPKATRDQRFAINMPERASRIRRQHVEPLRNN